MDTHLEAVPRVCSLTTRRLARRDLERLCRHADGALDLEVLVLGAADEVGAHFLERLDVTRGKGDANLLVLRDAAKYGLLHWGRHDGDVRAEGLVAVTGVEEG